MCSCSHTLDEGVGSGSLLPLKPAFNGWRDVFAGRYVAKFKDGRAIDGQFFFEDGLQYQPQVTFIAILSDWDCHLLSFRRHTEC